MSETAPATAPPPTDVSSVPPAGDPPPSQPDQPAGGAPSGDAPQIDAKLLESYTAQGIPAKFHRATAEETTKAMAEAYTNLEKSRNKPAEKNGDGAPAPSLQITKPEATGETDLPDTPAAVLERASLESAEIEKQWNEHGALTDAQYEAIAKVNPAFTKGIVDSIAEGMASKSALYANEQKAIVNMAVQVIGTKEGVDNLLAWADETLEQDEIDSLNERLGKSKTTAKGALIELKARHAEAVGAGNAQELITATHTPNASGGFETHAEMMGAMRDSREKFGDWKKDPGFMRRYNATEPAVRSSMA